MKYVAFLRGIGPSNPNMRGTKLKTAAEAAGFKNVQTLLSSGNVLFESDSLDQAAMEAELENIWPVKLGFNSMTIVRSQKQLRALASADPYKNAVHGRESYLLVTFFKTPPKELSAKPNFYTVEHVNALCSIIDTTAYKTTDFMAKADKAFGKDQITSRTWLTVQRILTKMAA